MFNYPYKTANCNGDIIYISIISMTKMTKIKIFKLTFSLKIIIQITIKNNYSNINFNEHTL